MLKYKLKYFIMGLLVGLSAFAGISFASQGSKMIEALYSDIKIYIDGVKLEPKDVNGNTVEPFIHNGTTYLPVRAIGNAIGKKVTWNEEKQTVFLGEVPPEMNFDGVWVSEKGIKTTIDFAEYKENYAKGTIKHISDDFQVAELQFAGKIVDDFLNFTGVDNYGNEVAGYILFDYSKITAVSTVTKSNGASHSMEFDLQSFYEAGESYNSLYVNEKIGFSLVLPASWNDKYEIVEYEESVSFFHKGNRHVGGELFTVLLAEDTSAIPMCDITGYKNGMKFVMMYPENPAIDYMNLSLVNEYNEMVNDFFDIKNSFVVIN